MPDSKISQLSNGDPAVSTDEVLINRGGFNYKLTAGSIAELKAPGGSSGQLQYNNNNIFAGASGITTTGTEITIQSGIKLTNTPILDLRQTWNTGSVACVGLKMDITNTSSGSYSSFMSFYVGGSERFGIHRDGYCMVPYARWGGFATNSQGWLGGGYATIAAAAGYGVNIYGSAFFGFAGGNGRCESNAIDTGWYRDDAGIIGQRNGINAQAYRIYNTYTDANNYERGFLRWASNVFEIGAEAAGTGVAPKVYIKSRNGTFEFNYDNLIWYYNNTEKRASIQFPYDLLVRGNTGGTVQIGGNSATAPHVIGRIDSWAQTPIYFTIRPGDRNANGLYEGPGFHLALLGGKAIAGATYGPNLNGGNVYLDGGAKTGSGADGDIIFGATRGNLQITDARNIILGTTTGTKIGTSADQKIGFYNASPIAQQTTAVSAASFTANSSGIDNDTATFDGYTIGQIVKALRTIGILA